jgi:thiosulfate/3-mercaptopyruvate sulfurtransferase
MAPDAAAPGRAARPAILQQSALAGRRRRSTNPGRDGDVAGAQRWADGGAESTETPALVSTDWLAAHLDDEGVRVADVRWYLPHVGKQGREEYGRGHIPGAVFVDLETALAGPRGSGPGRHPLPAPEVFAAAMSRAGVGAETHVVAYDDAGGSIAARLWWLLRHMGHPKVSVLDGGVGRWSAEGRALTDIVPAVTPAAFTATPRTGHVVDKDAVRRLSRDPQAVVLDARAAERYEGRSEPVDPRAGHVPGALSAPYTANLRAEEGARLKSREALRAQFAALGVVPGRRVVAYCGSGITACHNLLALHVAGIPDALLYEGSWSDWSSDPELPATTGPAPE